MAEFIGGMVGVLLALCLFKAGRDSVRREEPAATPLTPEEERQRRRTLRELTNFYTYDGTAQAEADEAALTK